MRCTSFCASKMDDEKLIKCVEKYPAIYDVGHTKYLDQNYKSSVWKIIAEELKQNDDTCRKRWCNMRDQFRKNLIKRRTKSSEGAKIIKRYKYEDILQFLIPHLQEIDITRISENENNSQLTQNDVEINQEEKYMSLLQTPGIFLPTIHPIDNFNSTLPHPDVSSSIFSTSNGFASIASNQNNSGPSNRKRRNRRVNIAKSTPLKNRTEALMKYIIESNEKAQNDIHPIDAFLNGLAPTIRKFSPYYQHLAKGKIFEVVQQLEWEQFQPSGPSTDSYEPPIKCEKLSNSPTSTPLQPPTPTSTTLSTLTPPTTTTNLEIRKYFS